MISSKPAPRKLIFLGYCLRATQNNDWKVESYSEPLRISRSADFANLQNLLRAHVATLQVCRWMFIKRNLYYRIAILAVYIPLMHRSAIEFVNN
jgi:hypothetical protein